MAENAQIIKNNELDVSKSINEDDLQVDNCRLQQNNSQILNINVKPTTNSGNASSKQEEQIRKQSIAQYAQYLSKKPEQYSKKLRKHNYRKYKTTDQSKQHKDKKHSHHHRNKDEDSCQIEQIKDDETIKNQNSNNNKITSDSQTSFKTDRRPVEHSLNLLQTVQHSRKGLQLETMAKDEIIIELVRMPPANRDIFDQALLIEYISKIAFFQKKQQEFNDDLLQEFAQSLQYEFIQKDQTVFAIGSIGNKLYLVLKGLVGVMVPIDVQVQDAQTGVQTLQTKRIEVAEIGSGRVFGELALEMDTPRTATIYAKENTHFAVITRAAFKKIVKSTKSAELINKKINYLKGLFLFKHIPKRSISTMMYYFIEQNCSFNQCIYRKGEVSDRIFFIVSGGVRVCQDMPIPREKFDLLDEKIDIDLLTQRNLHKDNVCICHLHENEVFGYEALDDNVPRQFNVYCNTQEVQLLYMTKQVINQLLIFLSRFFLKKLNVISCIYLNLQDLQKRISAQSKQILLDYIRQKGHLREKQIKQIQNVIEKQTNLFVGEFRQKTFSFNEEVEKHLKAQFNESELLAHHEQKSELQLKKNIRKLITSPLLSKKEQNLNQNIKQKSMQIQIHSADQRVESQKWEQIMQINQTSGLKEDWRRDAQLANFQKNNKYNQTLGFTYELKSLQTYLRHGNNDHVTVIQRLKDLNQLDDCRFDLMRKKRVLRSIESAKYKLAAERSQHNLNNVWTSPFDQFKLENQMQGHIKSRFAMMMMSTSTQQSDQTRSLSPTVAPSVYQSQDLQLQKGESGKFIQPAQNSNNLNVQQTTNKEKSLNNINNNNSKKLLRNSSSFKRLHGNIEFELHNDKNSSNDKLFALSHNGALAHTPAKEILKMQRGKYYFFRRQNILKQNKNQKPIWDRSKSHC